MGRADDSKRQLGRANDTSATPKAVDVRRRRHQLTMPCSLEGNALPQLVRAWTKQTKAKSKRFTSLALLEREEKAYGAPFAKELRAFFRLAHAGELGAAYGELRTFAAGGHVLFDGEDAAERHLAQARRELWMIGLHALLVGCYPIGKSPAGDFWLARCRADDGSASRVYFFDHEEWTLHLAHYSISEFLHANTFAAGSGPFNADTRDAHTLKFRTKASKRKLTDDPLRLHARTEWLANLLGDKDLDELAEMLANAPSAAAWKTEKKLIASAPHLAIYWLWAHWALGNRAELEEARTLVKRSKNALVRSLLPWVERPTPIDARFVQLRSDAPSRLLGVETKAKATSEKRRASVGAKGAVARAVAEGGDLVAVIAAHPDDVALHGKALAAMAAKDSDARFREAVRLYGVVAAGKGSWPNELRLGVLADERLRIPIMALVRRGYGFDQFHKKSAAKLVAGVARFGGPDVLELLLAASDKGADRLADVARGLAQYADPRVDAWLRKLLDWLAKTEKDFYYHSDELFSAALDVLSARSHDEDRDRVLRWMKKTHNQTRLGACAHAVRRGGWREAGADIEAMLRTAFEGNPSVVGPAAAALAIVDPKRAHGVLPELWAAENGDAWQEVLKGWGRYNLAGLLAGLLVLEPRRGPYLEVAERILAYRGGNDTELAAVGHVLLGVTGGRVVEAADWVRPHLTIGDDGADDADDVDRARVRAAAPDALVACGLE